MRDLLPENGASAVAIRDPQAVVAVVLTHCAYCGEELRYGEQAVQDSITGEHFCDELHAAYYMLKKSGALIPVTIGEAI